MSLHKNLEVWIDMVRDPDSGSWRHISDEFGLVTVQLGGGLQATKAQLNLADGRVKIEATRYTSPRTAARNGEPLVWAST